MCGLTGLYAPGKGRDELEATARRMADAIRHRGPDAGAVWADPDVPLALGHRRLSIIDLSEAGAQPMVSESGRFVLIFNGEIYNYMALKTDLEKAGVGFRGRSDTEALLAAVERWGLNAALQKINGMFAFALWDRREKILHAARDRLGKKPFYIGWADKNLVFGSELKALRALPDFRPEINPEALSIYMRHGYVTAPHCIYKSVWTLPPGHRISLAVTDTRAGEDLSRRMEAYWNPLDVLRQARLAARPKTDAQAVDEFEALLGRCVRDRMISDVPLGAFLSGGIDSSLVVALMRGESARPVQTFSIGFKEKGFDEAGHAAKIARHLGTNHHELYLSAKDARDVVPRLPDIYDEPFADISAIPTYLVSKFARSRVAVALSGDGGDEMLGGYTRHVAAPKIRRAIGWAPRSARRLLARGIEAVSIERWNDLFPMRPQIGVGLHKAASVMGLPGEWAIYDQLASQGADVFMRRRPPPSDANDADLGGLTFAEKMMFWDARSYLPDDILVKVDRASMAVSLEARAPLLDPRIYEYVWSLPEKFKIRGGKGKWLLRQVLKRHAPADLFERPKQGFALPVAEWLRGDLKEWARETLRPQNLEESGLFNASAIGGAWNDLLAYRGNHARALWTVLMFEAWRARWT